MSSEAPHTPGPWHSEGPDEFGDYNIHHPADRLAVAAVISNGRPAAEVAANAALVASARDLLEAVKSQHSAIDTLFAVLIERDRTFFPTQSSAWAAVERGHAALCKALGTTP